MYLSYFIKLTLGVIQIFMPVKGGPRGLELQLSIGPVQSSFGLIQSIDTTMRPIPVLLCFNVYPPLSQLEYNFSSTKQSSVASLLTQLETSSGDCERCRFVPSDLHPHKV